MPTARGLRDDRLAIGQLLVRLLAAFREDMLAGASEHYPELRAPHLHIFGSLGINGIRMTELAAKTQLSPAATSEFVTELERLGFVERRPDPSDGRARLIFPSKRGRAALDDAGDRVARLEQRWAQVVGKGKFEAACRVLQDILDHLPEEAGHGQ